MLSFGQRLKLIRKDAQITQAELSEKLMVSVQAVSKWECDSSMPDISQIVPLAAILGVTTDCLLGVGGNENEDREKLYNEIRKIYADKEYGVYTQNKEEHDKCYELYRDHIRKYPLDYDVKFSFANELCHYIYNSPRMPEKLTNDETKKLCNEALTILNSVVNYDMDTKRLIESKQIQIMLYLYTNDFERAEMVCESLPRIGKARASMEIEIYSKRYDFEKCIEIAERACIDTAHDYLWSLGVKARMLSNSGISDRYVIISAWRDLIRNAENVYKICGDHEIKTKWWYTALNYLSNEYIVLSETDNAIETIEELCRVLIDHYNELKNNGEDRKAIELKNNFDDHLKRCYNWHYKNDNNIITNDTRFKKCLDRLKNIG